MNSQVKTVLTFTCFSVYRGMKMDDYWVERVGIRLLSIHFTKKTGKN